MQEAYGPDWWADAWWLALVGPAVLIAGYALIHSLVTRRADRKRDELLREEQKRFRRDRLLAQYERAHRQLLDFDCSGASEEGVRFALVEAIRAWEELHRECPEFCPPRPDHDFNAALLPAAAPEQRM